MDVNIETWTKRGLKWAPARAVVSKGRTAQRYELSVLCFYRPYADNSVDCRKSCYKALACPAAKVDYRCSGIALGLVGGTASPSALIASRKADCIPSMFLRSITRRHSPLRSIDTLEVYGIYDVAVYDIFPISSAAIIAQLSSLSGVDAEVRNWDYALCVCDVGVWKSVIAGDLAAFDGASMSSSLTSSPGGVNNITPSSSSRWFRRL